MLDRPRRSRHKNHKVKIISIILVERMCVCEHACLILRVCVRFHILFTTRIKILDNVYSSNLSLEREGERKNTISMFRIFIS
jgi:hypothetical protein